MNVLIYDIGGSHFENVRASFLHTAPSAVNIIREFGLSDRALRQYCKDNDIDILIIPLANRAFRHHDIMQDGTLVVTSAQRSSTGPTAIDQFGAPIAVGGGDAESLHQGDGLEVYTQALNFSEPQRNYTSYTCAALAGMIASSGLIGNYTPFEIKQIVRQNGSNYPNHSPTQGFGKVTYVEEKEIEETMDLLSVRNWQNQTTRLVYLRYTEPDFFEDTPKVFLDGEEISVETLADDTSKWALIPSQGFDNQTDFTVTYDEPEPFNTGNIGATIPEYTIQPTSPVFNETIAVPHLVDEGDFKNYSILHRENDAGNIRRYDIVMCIVKKGGQEYSRLVTTSNLIRGEFLNLEENEEYEITFEVYANGQLYPETDTYTYSTETGEITFDGTIFDPNDDEIPEPDEPDIEPDIEPEVPNLELSERNNNLLLIDLKVTPRDGFLYKLYESGLLLDESEDGAFSVSSDNFKRIFQITESLDGQESQPLTVVVEPEFIPKGKNDLLVGSVDIKRGVSDIKTTLVEPTITVQK